MILNRSKYVITIFNVTCNPLNLIFLGFNTAVLFHFTYLVIIKLLLNCVASMFFKLYISVNICFQHSSTHESYIGNFPVLGLQHKNEKANNTLELKL